MAPALKLFMKKFFNYKLNSTVMKRIIFLCLFFTGLFFCSSTRAQVSVSINIGNQPAWAPEGYDDAQSYYIPDMDIYYDVPAHQFLYQRNRQWVRTSTLPSAYRKYDLYSVHKVPITQRNAYKNHDKDKTQYAKYRGQSDQHPIRDSHDNKYAQNKNNWNNNKFRHSSNNGQGGDRKQGDGRDSRH
jgi:hypothetical protein